MHRYFLIPMIGFFIIICVFLIYLQFINKDWKYLVPKTPLPEVCDDNADVELIIHDYDYINGRSFKDNPDVIKGNQIHAIFLLPCEREDRRFDVNSNGIGDTRLSALIRLFKNEFTNSPTKDYDKILARYNTKTNYYQEKLTW